MSSKTGFPHSSELDLDLQGVNLRGVTVPPGEISRAIELAPFDEVANIPRLLVISTAFYGQQVLHHSLKCLDSLR